MVSIEKWASMVSLVNVIQVIDSLKGSVFILQVVTLPAGVLTIWQGQLSHVSVNGKLSAIKTAYVEAQAVSPEAGAILSGNVYRINTIGSGL